MFLPSGTDAFSVNSVLLVGRASPVSPMVVMMKTLSPATIQKDRLMRALFDSVRYPRALVLGQRAVRDVRPHAAAEQQHSNAQSE
jgi:hypothetical protein